MVVGALVPTLVNVVFVLKVLPGWTKDFLSPRAALGGPCFSVVPVSRQKVFEQLRVGYVVTDCEGTIIDLNVAACRLLGKSEIALLGQPAFGKPRRHAARTLWAHHRQFAPFNTQLTHLT